MKKLMARALAVAAATASVLSGSAALAQAARTPAPAAGNLPAYRINPGDEIEIYVWGEERLQRSLRVLPDGSFSFPLVGRVDAKGKLPSELEQTIQRGLASQFRDQVPQVTVSIKAPTGFQVSVIGKVRSPGLLTPGRYVNVLDAVFLAGGPTEFANTNDVVIMRKQPNGGITPIRVRLSGWIKGDVSSREPGALPELESGDTVVVP